MSDLQIDPGVPAQPTDAGAYTPEMGESIQAGVTAAVGEVLALPAVQQKVAKGWATWMGYGTAAAAAIPVVLNLADVLNMPSWLTATFTGIAAVLTALTNKNRTDQARDLNRPTG